ncbi:MAG: signal recognition particle protein [Thermodesulfobacteriota bacterium]
MFEGLGEKLGSVFKRLKGHGTLSEANIKEALREIRMALLEADVNFKVAKDFVDAVKERAMGKDVLESLTPAQQFIKVVKDEITVLLGGTPSDLDINGSPPVPIMLVGLQGSGKTTTTAKLAQHLKSKGRTPFLVPGDIYRPAAILQLKKLAESIRVDCYDTVNTSKPVDICREALRVATLKGYDTLLVDTAGRLHIDEQLMEELREIKGAIKPREILFVADSMTGQDAVNTAKGFDESLDITGTILTKLDGDARGGAALSMRVVTGKPIKFIGTGEKLNEFEFFHPDRMAGRILGMGDVLTLVEKAYEVVDEKRAKELEKKIRKDVFTLEDFKEQLGQVKKMGSLENILSMIPGFKEMQRTHDIKPDERELVKIEAIIDSMTRKERLKPTVLNARRRQRIAKGSGTKVQDINKLMKQYEQMRKMMKKIKKREGKGKGLNFLKEFLPPM